MGLYLRSVKVSGDAADQCRELGIAVGDTITGREDSGCGHWHEARLTLLWLGETEAAWREQSRTNERLEWTEPREAVNWTLECRRWRKTPSVAAETAAEDLHARLHSLSKLLEGSGRIDEHEHPGAYSTILDAMNFCDREPALPPNV